jgi:hypothetical protein
VADHIGGSALLELDLKLLAECILLKVRGVLVQSLFHHLYQPIAIVDLPSYRQAKIFWGYFLAFISLSIRHTAS